MDDKRGCNHNVTPLEMLATSRNDCEGLSNAAKTSQVDGRFDKESLVMGNGQTEAEVKTRKPKVARSVLATLVVLLLLTVCIVVVVLVARSTDTATTKDKICPSSNCVISAAKLLNRANLSVNPCIDFYKYACGGWKAKNFMPESKSEWNGFTSRRETIVNSLKRALDSTKSGLKKGSAIDKVISFYHSCINTKQLDALGAEPLKTLLRELGSWPVLNDTWSSDGWKMEDAFFTHHNIFFSYIHHERPAPIFNSYVKVDNKNSLNHIISVSI